MATGATVPASNTRLKKTARAVTVQPQSQYAKQLARISHLVQPKRSSKDKYNVGTSNDIEVRRDNRWIRRLTRHMTKMETEVYQATAAMDAESVKLLNYKQLMGHPKYNGKWQVSSSNQFG